MSNKRFIVLIIIISIAVLTVGCDLVGKNSDGSKIVADKEFDSRLIVYVSGFVTRPGVYKVPLGTSVNDVIKLAGGLSPEADAAQVDGNATIIGTTQLYIPRVGEATANPAITASREAGQLGKTVGDYRQSQPEANQPVIYRSISTVECSSLEQQMLEMINQERTSRGLEKLTMDPRLVKSARLKSQDMVDNNYFAHQSPQYGSPSGMISAQGVSYHYCGENLAEANTVQDAHSGLMGSPGHRQNILLPNYTKIGIGIVRTSDNGLAITQHFVGD